MATDARGTSVSTTNQWMWRCASAPRAWMTAAMGNTMAAAMMPCTAPDSTFAMATSQMGHGAWTRSSISRVKPNSDDSCMATAWMPWNMIEMATTPGTSTVANAASAATPLPPPTPWPMRGNT